ncbi:MAG: hypothetical protein H7144_14600 [Burkholderiales bacterium]|nr:hypothetical protein [Phycisphaerae bacterium]
MPLKMGVPDREFDADTLRKLEKLALRRQKLEEKVEATKDDDHDAIAALDAKFETLEGEIQQIEEAAPEYHSEATKSTATVFLMLYPNGEVRREYRIPRQTSHRPNGENAGHANGDASNEAKVRTADDLNDRQLACIFTHQTLAVREALLKAPGLRKRVLVLVLHTGVRSEALAVRHEANAVTLNAETDGFVSEPWKRLQERYGDLNPFPPDSWTDEESAFQALCGLPDARLNQLIDLLTVNLLTAHLQRPTALVCRLASELKLELRQTWLPDPAWLGGYQKLQLAELLAELHGSTSRAAYEIRKKSELVDMLATLFLDAAAGKLEDKQLAERVNGWLPGVLNDARAANAPDRDR